MRRMIPHALSARARRQPAARRFIALAFAWLLAVPAAGAAGAGEEGERPNPLPAIVGSVDGEPVYRSELRSREIAELRQELYELERQRLRQETLERLRETRPEEFPAPETAVTEEEMREVYDKAGLSRQGSFEELSGRLREYLLQRKAGAIDAAQYRDALDKGYARSFLEPPPPYTVELDEVSRPTARGPRDAPVQIVEFSDFQCPYCNRARPVVEQVMERYEGRVRLVYRHLPLSRIHPRARQLAEAGECAAEQGRFWAYHDYIFDHQARSGELDLDAVAREAGVSDPGRFRECVDSRRYAGRVEADLETTEALGIGGTPTFFIGRRVDAGTLRGVLLEGAHPLENFRRAIDRILDAQS